MNHDIRQIVLAATIALSISGCSAAVWQGVAEGLAAASNTYATGLAPTGTKLMVFGGENHRTYLGCLSCSEYDSESIFNRYGSYGNQYSSTSILNRYGDFGSAYSTHGACNRYASDPPVIVDGAGNFYGRLTLNRYHPQAVQSDRILAWLAGACAS